MTTHMAQLGARRAEQLLDAAQWDRVVAHRGWLAARDRALAGLAVRPALVVVTGEAGTGKTLLLHEMSRVLRAGGIDAHVAAVDAAWLRGDERQPPPRGVLLVDDASRLDARALRRLGQGEHLLVLAARRDFAATIEHLPIAPWVVELAPLRANEVASFLAASLARTDRSADVFSEAAIARLADRSGGIPRALHRLAGMALLLAEREQTEQVETRHVDQAASVAEGRPVSPIHDAPALVARMEPEVLAARATQLGASPWRRRAAVGSAAALVVAGMAWTTLRAPNSVPRPPTPAIAEQAPGASQPGPVEPTPETAAGLEAAREPVVNAPAPEPQSSQAPAAIASAPPPVLAESPVAEPIPPSPLMAVETPPVETPPVEKPPVEARPVETRAVEAPAAAPEPPPPPPPPAMEDVAGALPPLVVAPTPSEPVETATQAGPTLVDLLPSTFVTVRFPSGNAESARLASRLAAGLRADGFTVAEPLPASERSSPGVRYAFAEDRDAAGSVAEAASRRVSFLPGTARQQPIAGSAVRPRPGAVDILVP